MRSIEFKKTGLTVGTDGLRSTGRPELKVTVTTSSLMEECINFLRFVVDYLLEQDNRIQPEETMNYGYWLVKFRQADGDSLGVWEYNAEATEFVFGATLTLYYWREQHRVCQLYKAEFAPPRPDKLTAVSKGVLEGTAIQAVRYPWQEHMSGWLFVTDEYDGDIKSLTYHHTYHVTALRPEVAPFIALPVGFRFELADGRRVWLDPEVAAQPRI
jgi:hypothetical protein